MPPVAVDEQGSTAVQPVTIRRFHTGDLPALIDLFRGTVRRVNSRDYTPEQVRAWAPDEVSHARWATLAERFAVVLSTVDEDPEVERRAIAELVGRRIAGLVIVPDQGDYRFLREATGRRPLPAASNALVAGPCRRPDCA